MSKKSRIARRRAALNTPPAVVPVPVTGIHQRKWILEESLEGLPPQDFQIIELDKMFVDDYQRLLHSDEVERIVKNFIPP